MAPRRTPARPLRPRAASGRASGRRARPGPAGGPQAPVQAPSGACPPDGGGPGQPTDRSPVGVEEIAPWYAAGAAFTVVSLPAGRVDVLSALAVGGGVLTVGAVAWLVILGNSSHTVTK
ncbi:hypothetical protein [Yinghuangia sp. YIM S09857]|uniref:hypothetical protein n=1 Tax=Yinghuangia sp. YIM S09857 TaxID=3436929 RepID=UPI003F536D6F